MTLESFSKHVMVLMKRLVLINSDGYFGWWCVMLTKVMALKIIWFWSLYLPIGSFEWWCVMLTKVMVIKIIWLWSLVMVVLGVGV